MYLNPEIKKEIFGKYGQSNSDTGSVESQVALFSYRIAHLTEHMKANRKDHTTERSLVKLVGKRRALLNYLKRKPPQVITLPDGQLSRSLPPFPAPAATTFCSRGRCVQGSAL